MLHEFIFTPFADPATAQLYDRLVATLRADSEPGPTLLLGHFAVADGGEPLDAVVIRPHSITVLVLVPRGGPLQMPALGYGAWLLNGRPLAGSAPEPTTPTSSSNTKKPRWPPGSSRSSAPSKPTCSSFPGWWYSVRPSPSAPK